MFVVEEGSLEIIIDDEVRTNVFAIHLVSFHVMGNTKRYPFPMMRFSFTDLSGTLIAATFVCNHEVTKPCDGVFGHR